jgi:hypothetical protein
MGLICPVLSTIPLFVYLAALAASLLRAGELKHDAESYCANASSEAGHAGSAYPPSERSSARRLRGTTAMASIPYPLRGAEIRLRVAAAFPAMPASATTNRRAQFLQDCDRLRTLRRLL